MIEIPCYFKEDVIYIYSLKGLLRKAFFCYNCFENWEGVMSKKKKKEPIVLSNQELIPSVIGIIDDKEKSNWPLIILFILLIGFIVGLPTITAYITGEKDITDITHPGGTDKNKEPLDPPMEVQYYTFSDTVNIDGITFSDFEIREGLLHLKITNQQEAKSYLAEHKLYLELYNIDKTLLQRIKLPSENLSKGNTQSYSFEINGASSNIATFTLDEKSEEDYPSVKLKKENDDIYSLTCTKGGDKVFYEFNAEQKLVSMIHTINYLNTQSDYLQMLTDYRQVSSKYNAIDGVTSNIVEAGNGFTFTTTLSLEHIDFTNRSIINTLNNKVFYGKDTLGKVVYFELSAMNYKCSV